MIDADYVDVDDKVDKIQDTWRKIRKVIFESELEDITDVDTLFIMLLVDHIESLPITPEQREHYIDVLPARIRDAMHTKNKRNLD